MSTTMPEEIFEKYPSLKKFKDEGYSEWKGGRERALLAYIKQHSEFAQMHDSPSKVLKAMDDFASQEDFLINIGSDKGRIVADLLTENKPKVLVELGGYVGYSAILFADQMRRSAGTDRPPRLWSLEFEPEFAAIAKELIAIAGLTEVVTVVTGPADESLRNLKADGELEHIDFLFIDHVEDLYEQDLKVCEELGLLKTGSVVVADNVVRPGAPKYREYVRGHPGLRSWGVRGLIMPGELEDELEVSEML
ncbi:S-adenosyl-L-methionine-dependent methyltransferase [Lindgomyces ingoldianus]|uniref:S-adenosyl-L-methionine-dependent methyltransferase n=1 Tax=Lindgomyces ingoldianus TaxID=673940 RepID=A0ACB6RH88_9PLEO|nr:S-adenosyl-L-methionine-dependent methyltransferase [Lindgomyces ingoldianus]KAF2477882.1 S-adenosyl-L-methionine-dependent methyltransferase [Lindgomyces ingoldianus]